MIATTYQQLSHQVASIVREQLKTLPSSCFGLPTGNTPLGCYDVLSTWSKDNLLDWSQAHCFALDEYLDGDETHSFASYLNNHLYKNTNLLTVNIHNPRLDNNYDELITQCGGFDLCIVGIGLNGHIAFNEPPAHQLSWTHCLWLTKSTREANANTFGSYELTPKTAITVGIATLMSSHKILLVASGIQKRDILRQALFGPIKSAVPASCLQQHPNLQVITDFEYQ